VRAVRSRKLQNGVAMKTLAVLSVAILLSAGPSFAQTGPSGDEISRRQALQHYRAGQEFLASEQYEQAAAAFTSAIELDSLLTLAHYGLGQSYMALKRYPAAVQAFTGCRDAYARLATLRQSDTIASERRMDDEMRELRESVSRVRSDQIKGAGQAMLQQLENRLEELETMRRSRGSDRYQIPAEVLLALGSAHYRNSQAQDAEREWRAAVSVNARLGEAHNNLAVLYLMTGRKKDAEEAVKAAERARFRVHPQLKEDIRKMK
jgi:tetratricopeptide (TPR) repeat protein